MKIYTRTGDDGSTGLFGGARVSKGSPRVEAYGTLDEANACIGRARVMLATVTWGNELDAVLAPIQSELFVVGAELSCAPGKEDKLAAQMKLIDAAAAQRLEREIDAAEAGLPPLKTFVLPGGTAAAAELHVCRCVTRRAERQLVSLQASDDLAERPRTELVIYLNRLSDLLFTLARRANHLGGVEDVPWIAHTTR